MEEKSFELSREKTCLMLFNNGENLKSLPQLEVSKHVALHPQKRDGLLGTGKGMEGRMSGSFTQSDPQKTEEAVDHHHQLH